MNRDGGAIIVVTPDAAVAETVATAAQAAEAPKAPKMCRDIHELVVALETTPTDIVIVDIGTKPMALLEELEGVISRHRDVRFAVLAGQRRSEWMLRAMQAGARHFLVKQDLSADLSELVSRATPQPTTNGCVGSLVTILSAGGGCGSTTIAVNLANELRLLSREGALIIDLDGWYGGASGYLGVTSEHGVRDVLADIDRLDAQLIRSSAVHWHDDLAVLVTPAAASFHDPRQMDLRALGVAMRRSKEAFRHIVVDAPRVSADVAETLARASIVTYIVFEPNVEHVRVAREMLATLRERGVGDERVIPLANRYRKRGEPITLEEARKAMGATSVACLSNDFRSAVASLNFGKPLAERCPRSALRREIQALAVAIRDRSPKAVTA